MGVPTLIAMIGPAGAGKTSWCRGHVAPGTVRVSLDENRAALSPCGCSANQAVNAAAVDLGVAATRLTLAAGGTVVWDVTSYHGRFRARLLDLASEADATTVGIVLLPPVDLVLARNAGRDGTRCPECGYARRVPDTVIWSMHHAITSALPSLHTEGWQTLRFLDLPYPNTRSTVEA